MKLLNLDELVVPNRSVTLNGNEYAIVEQSVGMMINAVQISQMKTPDSEEAATSVFMKMVDVAKTLIPSCPDSVIQGMTLNQLTALLEFATASDKEAVEGSEVEEEGAEKKQ